jgi:hypothetical protein
MTTQRSLQVRSWLQPAAEAHTGAEEKPMTDHDEVRAIALDYFEGWYDATCTMTAGGAP